MTKTVSQVAKTVRARVHNSKREEALKAAESYREALSSTCLTLTKICSLREGDPERIKLEDALDIPALISTLEGALGMHATDGSHSVSSKPPLIEGLSKEYAKQWRLVISSLFSLSKLHEIKFNQNENEYDKSKVGFNLEYARLMSFFHQGNSDLRSSDISDIKSRLIYFSKKHSIGRERFIFDVNHGRNLLALSSWLAGEYCKKAHPVPSSQNEFAKQIAKPEEGALELFALKALYRQRSFNF